MPTISFQPPTPQPKNRSNASLRFGMGLPANALRQLMADTLGVWGPKLPFTRSKQGFFEDAYLEWVENIPFYLLIPVAAPLLARRFAVANENKATPSEIGLSWKTLGQSALKQEGRSLASKTLVGAKAATLLSVLSLAFGWEYMVQPSKNFLTAKLFATKNFEAVAGLENRSLQVQAGNDDPVEKTKSRGIAVGLSVLGGLTLAGLTPLLVRHSGIAEKTARRLLHTFNFGDGFDLTKPILASVIGVGVVSYLDAARDRLEFKETASRLAMVVPYLLFGKELAGNLLASAFNWLPVRLGKKNEDGSRERVFFKDVFKHLSSPGNETGPAFSFRQSNNLWQQFTNPDSLLDLEHSKKAADIEKTVQALEKQGFSVPVETKEALLRKVNQIGWGKFILGALISGAGFTALTYHQTRKRWANGSADNSAKPSEEISASQSPLLVKEQQKNIQLPVLPPAISLKPPGVFSKNPYYSSFSTAATANEVPRYVFPVKKLDNPSSPAPYRNYSPAYQPQLSNRIIPATSSAVALKPLNPFSPEPYGFNPNPGQTRGPLLFTAPVAYFPQYPNKTVPR
ncbi:MAG: hypothetical protein AAGI66_07525 [Cyanobacteria bacterium P01_H01_bin.74]